MQWQRTADDISVGPWPEFDARGVRSDGKALFFAEQIILNDVGVSEHAVGAHVTAAVLDENAGGHAASDHVPKNFRAVQRPEGRKFGVANRFARQTDGVCVGAVLNPDADIVLTGAAERELLMVCADLVSEDDVL